MLILSDIASVISALQSETSDHPWIQAIIKNTPRSTSFAWIPGHCGIPGNVSADSLAGTGHSCPRYSVDVPFLDLKRWLVFTFRRRWQTEWNSMRSHHLRKVKESIEAWKDTRSHKDQQNISRLRTGHSRLSYNMGGRPFRIQCPICNVHATAEHVLCVCPEYESSRQLHGISGSIRDTLSDDPAAVKALSDFLKTAGLFNKI